MAHKETVNLELFGAGEIKATPQLPPCREINGGKAIEVVVNGNRVTLTSEKVITKDEKKFLHEFIVRFGEVTKLEDENTETESNDDSAGEEGGEQQ